MEHPQLRLRYALIKDTTEGLKFVDNVPNGLKCNCICPHCRKELVARNNPKNKREHHFAHRGGADCKGARMTTLHKLAQEVIAAETKVMLPEYKKQFVQKEAELRTFEQVKLEAVCKIEDSTRRPDCIGYNNDKKDSLWIEIYCRHKIDENKREEIRRSNQACIEIDFSDILNTDYIEESVRERLLTCFEDREWICHPVWDKEEAEKEADDEHRQEEARKQIEAEQRQREAERLQRIEEGLKLAQQREAARRSVSSAPKELKIKSPENNKPISDNPNLKDWPMWIKSLGLTLKDRENFYRILQRDYAKVTFKNSDRLVIEEAETKINQLLNANARNAILDDTKIYLEFVVVVWVLEHINRQGRYELSEIFAKDKTTRNTVLRVIQHLRSVSTTYQAQSIRALPIFQEAENQEAIMQILTICNIVK